MSTLNLSRQADMIGDLSRISALLVGAGGANSNAAHLMGSMGITQMTIVDFDTVSPENIAPGFFPNYGTSTPMNRPKAEVVRRGLATVLADSVFLGSVTAINETIESAFERLNYRYNLIVVAPDNIAARRWSWENLFRRATTYVDLAMGGKTAECFCIQRGDDDRIRKYTNSLQSFDTTPLPCGMKATAPLTMGALPLMLGQILHDISNDIEPPYFQQYTLGGRVFLSAV